MKRVYHPHTAWEEVPAGLWKRLPVDVSTPLLKKAVEFTGDPVLYGSWMRKVAKEWPISCEHNLTNKTQNRKAWIGHAACCMAIGAPEYVTRAAWWYLSKETQDAANEQASQAITEWEAEYTKRIGE